MKNVLRQISLPILIRQVSSLQKHDKNGKFYIYLPTIEIKTIKKNYTRIDLILFYFFILDSILTSQIRFYI